MLKYLSPLRTRGDTIIEVMVVLAVLGMAISICYATANRSLLNARQAQENSEATALAQSQLEALHTMTQDTSPNDIFTQIPSFSPFSPYCISPTTPYAITSGAAACKSYNHTQYDITVSANNSPIPGCAEFITTVTWPDIIDSGNDTVTLSKRLCR